MRFALNATCACLPPRKAMSPAARLVPVVIVMCRACCESSAAVPSLAAMRGEADSAGRGLARLLRPAASVRLSFACIQSATAMTFATRGTAEVLLASWLTQINHKYDTSNVCCMACATERESMSSARQGGHQQILDRIIGRHPRGTLAQRQRLIGSFSSRGPASVVPPACLRRPMNWLNVHTVTPGGKSQHHGANFARHQVASGAQQSRGLAIVGSKLHHVRSLLVCPAAAGGTDGSSAAETPRAGSEQSVQEALSAAEAALTDARDKLADVESLPSAREPWQPRVRNSGLCTGSWVLIRPTMRSAS